MRKNFLVLSACLGITLIVTVTCLLTDKKMQTDDWTVNPIPEKVKLLDTEKDYASGNECQMYINNMDACAPLNLTTEQKLKDFDVFCNTVQEKVYCLDELARDNGIHLEKLISDYREEVEKSENDVEFYRILKRFANIFKGVWHISLESPNNSLGGAVTRYLSFRNPEDKELLEGEIAKRWKYWDVILTQNDYSYKMEKAAEAELKMPGLQILNEKTAVIKIPTMAYFSSLKKMNVHLTDLMKQVSDYENIIFDLQHNGGGATALGLDYIIASNIDEPLTYSNVVFFKNTKDIQEARAFELWRPGKIQQDYLQYKIDEDKPLCELPENLQTDGADYGNADFLGKEV